MSPKVKNDYIYQLLVFWDQSRVLGKLAQIYSSSFIFTVLFNKLWLIRHPKSFRSNFLKRARFVIGKQNRTRSLSDTRFVGPEISRTRKLSDPAGAVFIRPDFIRTGFYSQERCHVLQMPILYIIILLFEQGSVWKIWIQKSVISVVLNGSFFYYFAVSYHFVIMVWIQNRTLKLFHKINI